MIIHLYTLVYNEMDILPFCIDYWKRFADHVYVYDNGSTDGSFEYLQGFDWITVEHFDSEGFDDLVNVIIKNSCWKNSRGKADWVCVCDCDELLFSNYLKEELQYMSEKGYTALGCQWFNFFAEKRPEYTEGKLLHELVRKGCPQVINWQDNSIGKITLFNPNEIEDMRYAVGCHTCSPTGNFKLFKSERIVTFHIDKGLGEDYKVEAFKKRADRLSDRNKVFGWGFHYLMSEKHVREEYKKKMNMAIDLTELDI